MVTKSQDTAARTSCTPSRRPSTIEMRHMITINGKYTEARVFTDELEDLARTQIKDVCHHPALKEAGCASCRTSTPGPDA